MGHVQGVTEELKQWDIAFWAERLREQRFNITDEELRPYFALPNVLKGLFEVCAHCISSGCLCQGRSGADMQEHVNLLP